MTPDINAPPLVRPPRIGRVTWAALMISLSVVLVSWRLSLAIWPQVVEYISERATDETLVVLTTESRREARRFEGMYVVSGACCTAEALEPFDRVLLVLGGPSDYTLTRALAGWTVQTTIIGDLFVSHYQRSEEPQ